MSWEDVLEKFASEFLKERERRESFDASRHSFYVHDIEMEYLSALLTGFVQNFYYMKAEDVFKFGKTLHGAMLNKDAEFHIESLKVARKHTAMKDQVLIGVLSWTKHKERKKHEEDLVEILSTFPPSQIVKKFINTKRKASHLFGGLGTFEKRVLKGVFEKWEERGILEYYFAKYRRYMHQFVNVAHIPLEPEEYTYLSNPTRYSGKSEYLRAIARFLKSKRIEDLPEKAPFELVRSNLRKEEWTVEALEKCDLTGNTLVLQACSLYEAFGEDVLPLIGRAVRSPTVTSDKILKALIMAARKGYDDLARELARAYARKVKRAYKDLLLPVPVIPSVCAVIDASGSMEPASMRGMFLKCIASVAPFAPLINALVLFSEEAGREDPKLLRTWSGIRRLMNIAGTKYNSSTNIVEGLLEAHRLSKTGEIDTVIVATDEQANVVSDPHKEMDIIRKMLDAGVKVIVINPTPYPVRVTDISDKRLTYVTAANPEGVTAALKLVQMREELQRAGAKELIKML